MGAVSLVSIGFHGYELAEVLEGLSRTLCQNIILCCIDGFTKQFVPENTSSDDWEAVRRKINESGLKFRGLFGHCNVSQDHDLEKMKKRMLFTSMLGG
ncbi:MAG: hypothetical protein QW566_08835, partial [Candidatus Jordarchaeales archaeon]